MKLKIVIIFLFLFASLTGFSLNAQTADTSGGRKAPFFESEDLDGNSFDLQSVIGEKPVLLSFWATWCKPCHEEMKELQVIYNDLKENGLKFWAISKDDGKSVAKVAPFIKSKGFSFPVLFDSNSEISQKYYVQDPPHTFIINKAGEIVYNHAGYVKGDELKIRKILEELLK